VGDIIGGEGEGAIGTADFLLSWFPGFPKVSGKLGALIRVLRRKNRAVRNLISLLNEDPYKGAEALELSIVLSLVLLDSP